MAETTRIGIIGAGGPGMRHLEGLRSAGGCKLVAVADLIPERRVRAAGTDPGVRPFEDGLKLIEQSPADVVVLAVPTDLHMDLAMAAFRAGKHVVCEPPPALDAKQAKRMQASAAKRGLILAYAMQRRFSGAAQACRQALQRGYLGEAYHARAWLLRPRAVPVGTGWYHDPARTGGGVVRDLGGHMLDLVWSLLGEPEPQTLFAVGHRRLEVTRHKDLEESATIVVAFDGGATAEVHVGWAINQPAGEVCRIAGTEGGLDLYTPAGPLLFRGFGKKSGHKSTSLKLPKVVGHAAFYRHLRDCISGKTAPQTGGGMGITLMTLLDAASKSMETGRSVTLARTGTNDKPEDAGDDDR